MDTAVLVKTEREAAWQLLEALKQENFPMTAAYWQYLPDYERWRLYIATPLVETSGSIAAYSRLQELINSFPEETADGFSVSNISLLKPDARQIRTLQQEFGTLEFTKSRTRRINLTPNETYIYFLQ